jgi:membrane protein implicated in regulation of membrane protease activity
MQEWWTGLAGVTQFFYGMAAFFSVFFLWQIIAAFLGLDGDDADFDTDAGADFSDMDAPDDLDHSDVIESSQAFKILSLRSIITFFTLFSWGSALFTSDGMSVTKAMGISSIWGLVGMCAIAGIFYFMAKLSETGTKDVASCQGGTGTVYLDIPEGGFGEIKIEVSGAVEHVKARSVSGEALSAGTQVRVIKVIGQTLVGVEKVIEKGESQ